MEDIKHWFFGCLFIYLFIFALVSLWGANQPFWEEALKA